MSDPMFLEPETDLFVELIIEQELYKAENRLAERRSDYRQINETLKHLRTAHHLLKTKREERNEISRLRNKYATR
jgi:flagellar motility protein MotE (MotC chaperone)